MHIDGPIFLVEANRRPPPSTIHSYRTLDSSSLTWTSFLSGSQPPKFLIQYCSYFFACLANPFTNASTPAPPSLACLSMPVLSEPFLALPDQYRRPLRTNDVH